MQVLDQNKKFNETQLRFAKPMVYNFDNKISLVTGVRLPERLLMEPLFNANLIE